MSPSRSAALVVLLLLLITTGCAGNGSDRQQPAAAASRLVDPAGFAAAVAEPGRVTINVHVPFEGDIPGTDLSLPYDQVEARAADLPAPGTPLAIYCRSDRMSTIAAPVLASLGYSDIVELDGGMQAWSAAGRRVLPTPVG